MWQMMLYDSEMDFRAICSL